MTLGEMKGKIISEAEGKFGIAKEDLDIVYEEFEIPIAAMDIDSDLFSALVDKYYESGSEEKDFPKYMADEYARIVREKIDDSNEEASEVLEEIRKKIDPRTIEDAYKGKLFLISEYMIKRQEEIFDENKEEAIGGLTSFDEKKKYKEVIRNKVYKKLIENAILADDSFNEYTRKMIVNLIGGINLDILVDEEKVKQNCPRLVDYIRYVNDIFSNKVKASFEKFDDEISKGVSDELISIISNIFTKSHVVAENMKNLCKELKEKVEEVPAIDEE